VGPGQLTAWSALMATAHGAGLMVLPLLLGDGNAALAAGEHAAHTGHGAHVAHASLLGGQAMALMAAFIHAVGYLAVTTAVALVIYHRVGLKLLRTAWINLDVIWAGTLIATALITVII
jgi:hypothetical protein